MYVITTSHIRDAIIILLDQKQGRLSLILFLYMQVFYRIVHHAI